jgi:Gpi18-like mannosyltransferase
VNMVKETIKNRDLSINSEPAAKKQNFLIQSFKNSVRFIEDFIKSTPSSWRYVLIVFMTVKILAAVTAVIGVSAIPNEKISDVPSYEKPSYSRNYELTAGVWERADALWYISIARFGYENKKSKSVFMPLYPVLIRTVKKVTGLPWLSSALLISNISLILALYFIYRLTEIEKDEDTARRAIWYQALFPGSIFLFAPYTESLFLALAAGSFYAARQKKWWLAGIAGALASGTRNIGVLLIVPLAIEFFRQYKKKETENLKHAAWLMLTPLGLLSYIMYWWLTSGNPLIFVQGQEHWHRTFSFPWITVGTGIWQAYEYIHAYPGAVYALEAIAVSGAIIFGVVAFRTLPASYGTFIFLSLTPALSAPFSGRVLMSCMRFSSVLFPVFITLASVTRNENIDQLIKLVFAGLFGISLALYVTSHFMI